MSAALQFAMDFTVVTCCRAGCGIHFAVPRFWEDGRRNDHASFYCPNGHIQYYPGKSDAERLRDEKAALETQVKAARAEAEWQRRQRDHSDRRAAAARGLVTKMKRRAGAGVCPCCTRTFSQLARHMATKHPDYAEPEETR